jgi:hypothetical protein
MPSVAIPNVERVDVQALCRSLVTEPQPVLVEHRPLPGKPLKECFPIVTQHIAERGGSQVFGWALLELCGIWVEAEFHTVWRSPEGSLLDLTPREFAFEKLLFLPDPSRKYTGAQVASVFHPLTEHPAVLRHIQLAHAFFVETNRGELAFAQSYVLTPEIAAMQAEMRRLLLQFPWQ